MSGLRGRHDLLGARRERRPRARALVQIPSSARHAERGGSRRNTLLQVRDAGALPNVRGDVVPAAAPAGTCAQSIPAAAWRATGSRPGSLRAFLPVGFYYKAFHSKRWFPRWERMFRALTGLGQRGSGGAAREHAQALRFLRCAGDRRRPVGPRGRAGRGRARRRGAAGR